MQYVHYDYKCFRAVAFFDTIVNRTKCTFLSISFCLCSICISRYVNTALKLDANYSSKNIKSLLNFVLLITNQNLKAGQFCIAIAYSFTCSSTCCYYDTVTHSYLWIRTKHSVSVWSTSTQTTLVSVFLGLCKRRNQKWVIS